MADKNPDKLLDAMLRPTESKLDGYMSDIDDEIKTMNELKDAGHIAQTVDIMEIITDTGIMVGKLHESLASKADAISTAMGIISARLDHIALETGRKMPRPSTKAKDEIY